jgi:hypothetical protein
MRPRVPGHLIISSLCVEQLFFWKEVDDDPWLCTAQVLDFGLNGEGIPRLHPHHDFALYIRPFQVSVFGDSLPFHWEIEFPEVFTVGAKGNVTGGFDVLVGNPPFAGKNTLIDAHADGYLDWLLRIHEESHGNSDLVAHFFRRAFDMLRSRGCFGVIATKTIGQGDTRSTGLRWICTHGGTIYQARKRLKWPGEAQVTVSIVHVSKGDLQGPRQLDGRDVPVITAYLFHAGGNENPARLRANARKAFIGSYVLGMGFTFDDTDIKGVATPLPEMRRLIQKDPRNSERIFPYIGGEEVNGSPTHAHHRFVINFEDWPLRREAQAVLWKNADEDTRARYVRSNIVPLDYPDPVAADYPDLLEIVERKVKPDRQHQGSIVNPARWWMFARPATELRKAVEGSGLTLAVSRVSEHLAFAYLPAQMVFAETIVAIVVESFARFAEVQSRAHEIWARFFASSLEDRLRYSPSDCFETYPFPPHLETLPTLEQAGRGYYEFRAAFMVRNNEGLTTTYNRFHDPEEDNPDILRLRELHAAMDRAVLDAYGWNDIQPTCEFLLDYEEAEDGDENGARRRKKPWRYRWPDEIRDEVLARLLQLNRQRALEEGQVSAAAESVGRAMPNPKRSRKTEPVSAGASLIGSAPES